MCVQSKNMAETTVARGGKKKRKFSFKEVNIVIFKNYYI